MSRLGQEIQVLVRGFSGLNTRDAELALPPEHSPAMKNVDLHPVGGIRRRNGTASLTTPDGVTKVDALFYLNQPVDGRSWLYMIANDQIYRTLEPATWSWEEPAPVPSLPTQTMWSAAHSRYYNHGTSAEYPSVLYIPRSDAAPLIALGKVGVTNDLVTMPTGATGNGTPDSGTRGYPPEWSGTNWPTHMRFLGVGKRARMVAWGCPDTPDGFYFSEVDVPYNFMQHDIDNPSYNEQEIDGGYAAVRASDNDPRSQGGDEIVSIFQVFDYWVIAMKHNILMYAGDPGSDDWRRVREMPVGMASDHAWQRIGNEILFWSDDGVRVLSAVQEYGDLAQSEASYLISGLTSLVPPSGFARIRSFHDIENRRVIWFVPTTGATYNDRAYVYYYDQQKWAMWDGNATQMNDLVVIKTNNTNNEKFIGGTHADGVVELGSGFYDLDHDEEDEEDPNDIDSDYQTDWILPPEGMRTVWLDIFFGDEGDKVDVQWRKNLNQDWNDLTYVSSSFGGGDGFWGGGFTWDETAWDTQSRTFKRFALDEICHALQFRFKREGHASFEVMKYRLGYVILGERVGS